MALSMELTGKIEGDVYANGKAGDESKFPRAAKHVVSGISGKI